MCCGRVDLPQALIHNTLGEKMVWNTKGNPVSSDLQNMARWIFVRFGEDLQAATAAWNRMMQTNIPTASFRTMLDPPEVDPSLPYGVMLPGGRIVFTGETERDARKGGEEALLRQGAILVFRADPVQPWAPLSPA